MFADKRSDHFPTIMKKTTRSAVVLLSVLASLPRDLPADKAVNEAEERL